jgi:uncharacterized membrane protein
MKLHRNLDEQKLEDLIAHLLRAGVVAAALVVIGGAVFYLGIHPWARVDYRAFKGEPEPLKAVHGIMRFAFSADPTGIMQLGLLILIATPIARVIFSMIAFAIENDRMYVWFTMIVLGVLMYSLFGSFLIA